MLNFIKKNIFIIIIFIITLFVGFLTFLTFIDKSFLNLSEENLQYLLLSNIFLLLIFFGIIFLEIKNSIKNEITVKGSRANRKYITFFSLFTLIPSILISIFSLFLFSFALEKYFDKKITTAVNNSHQIAKNYVKDVRDKIESEIILVAYDLDKNNRIFNDNKISFQKFLNTQKLIRKLDAIHLIDNTGKLILTTQSNISLYTPPSKEALRMVLNDSRPLKILNAYTNMSAALMKLNEFENLYVYVIKNLDPKISQYLTQSSDALSFYYTVQDKRTGIKYSFAIIYIIIVTLLLFLSISVAIKFSSRFFLSINNLISASTNIGKGVLDTKVPEIKTDKELELLNKNFNLMIDRLKSQQNRLLANERHEAWEHVARKIAHEIKNPLTPIQLIIDTLKNKYTDLIDEKNKEAFKDKIKTINKQVRLIEKLVNEFSNFARMPKPIFKKYKLNKIIEDSIALMKENDKDVKFVYNVKGDFYLNCDIEQISRVFINLLKNSIESLKEKYEKIGEFTKKINVEITQINDYINVVIIDNGTGFNKQNFKNLSKPYFTTKKTGSGLGLSIVEKIINDHNGTIELYDINDGAKLKIILPNYVN